MSCSNRQSPAIWTRALRIASRAVSVVCVYSMSAGVAWAQNAGAPAYDIGKSYVYSYAAVALGIALGVYLIGKPGTREESVESRMDLSFSE